MIHRNESSSPHLAGTQKSAYSRLMDSAFGREVKSRLKALGISQRAFATAVGVSQANLNKILNGTHGAPPPPTGVQLQLWAGIVQVLGDERQRFIDLAALAHLPTGARGRFESWYEEHQQLKADYADLLNQVRRVADK